MSQTVDLTGLVSPGFGVDPALGESTVTHLLDERLAPLAWHTLQSCGRADAIAGTARATLRAGHAAAVIEAGLLNTELRRVLDAFAQAGLDAVVIKGAALAHTHYARPHLRPRGDTDLVIRIEGREALFGMLERLGYQGSGAVDGSLVTRQSQWSCTIHGRLTHTLDVHWHVFNPHAFTDVLTASELLDEAVPAPRLAPAALVPHPVHALLIACVHRIAHHPDDGHALWLYDIHLVAEALSDADAAAFVALASEKRVRAICAHSLDVAWRRLGTRLPRPLRSLLDEQPWLDTSEPTAAYLCRGRRQVDHLMSDLRALPGLGRRARLVMQHLFPRADYMRRQYSSYGRAALPYLYLRRIAAGAPRWLRRSTLVPLADDTRRGG